MVSTSAYPFPGDPPVIISDGWPSVRTGRATSPARCGFAGYFQTGKWVDHWIVEHWAGERWQVLDAQIDDFQREVTGLEPDPSDLPVGYFLTGYVTSQPNRQLVRDLPVIENVDLYRHADSVDFLRELDKQGFFAEEGEDAI